MAGSSRNVLTVREQYQAACGKAALIRFRAGLDVFDDDATWGVGERDA